MFKKYNTLLLYHIFYKILFFLPNKTKLIKTDYKKLIQKSNNIHGGSRMIVSFSPFGFEGALVNVEVDLRRGIPAIDLVGLADNAVKESRERMRAAIRNSGFEFPKERVLISLSPADLKKEGAGFDLAIALAVLAESALLGTSWTIEPHILVMGELELSGSIRKVRGVHAAVSTAYEKGFRYCIVPKENEVEASFKSGMKVIAVEHLVEAFNEMNALALLENNVSGIAYENEFDKKDEKIAFFPVTEEDDFVYVKGLDFLVRGLQIAAAGGHNLIAYGPPGCGKTLSLQKFHALLPKLRYSEALPVTRIYSLAGLLKPEQNLIEKRPFRRPHQTASLEGMIGGGPYCRPGEVSLAHNGVLFLDEGAEFRSNVLQALRVPLEEGRVSLSRAGRNTSFPASFQLLIAANPCPCGNFGVKNKICLCPPRAVEAYWKKFSSPLLDRIDIRVPVFNKIENIMDSSVTGRSTEDLRVDIAKAFQIQEKRQGKCNARLGAEEVDAHCPLGHDLRNKLLQKSRDQGFSSRAIHSVIKLSRTIADMAARDRIIEADLDEAILYRKNEGGLDILF